MGRLHSPSLPPIVRLPKSNTSHSAQRTSLQISIGFSYLTTCMRTAMWRPFGTGILEYCMQTLGLSPSPNLNRNGSVTGECVSRYHSGMHMLANVRLQIVEHRNPDVPLRMWPYFKPGVPYRVDPSLRIRSVSHIRPCSP